MAAARRRAAAGPRATPAGPRPRGDPPPAPEGAPLAIPLPGRPYLCHVGTPNLSFLRTSQLLVDAGVRNSRFMLALFDEGLAGADPRSPDLDDETRGRVLVEVSRNPWYFFREVVRIPVPGGELPFELHLGNLFLLWCMVANINCFLVLPRQNYKTVSACCFYLWVYCFGTTNSNILFFNKELADAKNNLKRVKDVYLGLPAWLQEKILDDSIGDRLNIEFISSGHRNNRIDAKPAGKDPSHADLLGRGATVPLKWFDELSFAKYIRETYMAAAPAGSKASELAAANKRPFGTCITTTPGYRAAA